MFSLACMPQIELGDFPYSGDGGIIMPDGNDNVVFECAACCPESAHPSSESPVRFHGREELVHCHPDNGWWCLVPGMPGGGALGRTQFSGES